MAWGEFRGSLFTSLLEKTTGADILDQNNYIETMVEGFTWLCDVDNLVNEKTVFKVFRGQAPLTRYN